jgi:hypothetical protein
LDGVVGQAAMVLFYMASHLILAGHTQLLYLMVEAFQEGEGEYEKGWCLAPGRYLKYVS